VVVNRDGGERMLGIVYSSVTTNYPFMTSLNDKREFIWIENVKDIWMIWDVIWF
jgi:hypothetical protein